LQCASEIAKRLADRCNSGDIVTSPSLPTLAEAPKIDDAELVGKKSLSNSRAPTGHVPSVCWRNTGQATLETLGRPAGRAQ
jgi:hypothetical protein